MKEIKTTIQPIMLAQDDWIVEYQGAKSLVFWRWIWSAAWRIRTLAYDNRTGN